MMKVCVYLLAFVPLVAAGLEGSYSFLDSSVLVARANPVSTDGNCASNSKVGATCQGSTFGNCCSAKGFCGDTVDYCGEGCQFDSGTCDGQAGGKQIVSTSGSCGIVGSQNVTCQGATMGDCCSEKGFCGKTSDYCSTGCQSMFGTCDDATTPPKSSSTPSPKPTSSKTSSAPPTPTASGSVSVDGNCGSNSDISAICLGSEFGDCCSEKGFCGGNSSYCATGCQSAFGKCSSPSSTSSTASPTTTPSSSNSSISLDGNCGRNSANLATCLGSTFGDCCSERGYCGGNSSYCGAGCLSSWGRCGASNATTSATPVPSQILSSGAKAGIGIGCALLGVAVVGLIVWYVLRLRRKRRDGPVELDARVGRDADADLSLVDNGGKNVPLMGWGDEKGKSERVEMDGRSVAFEMDAARGPVELSGLTKREEEERRKRLVDERAAAGYEGAYRGN